VRWWRSIFGRHRDAEIYASQPGLGVILGARVLAEFGDDPHRYADAKARKNYAGTAPITRPGASPSFSRPRIGTSVPMIKGFITPSAEEGTRHTHARPSGSIRQFEPSRTESIVSQVTTSRSSNPRLGI
jgi:Transposase IS116/IS110/IS902 family